MKSIFVVTAIVSGLAFCGGCAGGGSSVRESSANANLLFKGISRHALENGMIVVVAEDHRLPIMTAAVFYRVGAVNEGETMTGISHFLEHMMFKGTEKYGKGAIDLRTYKNGGDNNAYTNSDYTGYYFNWGSDRWEEAIDIIRSWMTDCTIDGKDLDSERQVIWKSELFKNLSSQSYLLYEEMLKYVYAGHPYSHPTLGSKKDLEGITREMMAEYYRQYYKPNNAILVVAGDVRTDRVLEKAKALFLSVSAGTPSSGTAVAGPLEKGGRFVIETPHQSSMLEVDFKTEKIGSESDYVFDVVAAVLGRGKSSRMHKRLVEQERLASVVYVWNDAQKFAGSFAVRAVAVPGASLERIEEVIFEELEKIRTEPFTNDELSRAKSMIAAGYLFGKEQIHDVAMSLGHYEVMDVPGYMEIYLKKLQAIGREEIRATVDKYLIKDRAVVGAAVPRKAKEEGGIRQHYGPFEEPGTETGLGEYWEIRLTNGLTLMLLRRSDLPIVRIKAFVDAGRLYENEKTAGVARIVGDLLDEGTSDDVRGVRRSAEEIALAIENVGGQLSTSENGVEVQVLKKDAPLAYDLLHDLLACPTFPEDRLDLVKKMTVAAIRRNADDADTVGEEVFFETVFKGHPFHKPELGYAETVDGITRDDVLAHYRRYYRPDNTIIAVVGDISPQSVLAVIKARFIDWPASGRLNLPVVPRIERGAGAGTLYRTMDTEHLSVYIGHLGLRRSDPDYLTLRVADSIFGNSGFSSRLMAVLRSDRGLAYTVWGATTAYAGSEPGAFLCYIDPPPEKKKAAIDGLLEEIRKFADRGPTDEELANAKEHLKRKFVYQLETLSDLAQYMINMRRFNLGIDYYRKYPAMIDAVTKEGVMEALRRHVDPAKLTVVVVGPVDEKGNLIEMKGEK